MHCQISVLNMHLISNLKLALTNSGIWLLHRSLLVLRGNSSDMARHVMCPSPNKRVSITFFKVRSATNQITPSTTPPLSRAMTLWQPGLPATYAIPNGALYGYEAMNLMPKWGMLRAPLVVLAPMNPIVLSPRRVPHTGTGVFLPWTVGSRKSPKRLPPRTQKAKLLLTIPPSVEAHTADLSSDVSIGNDAKWFKEDGTTEESLMCATN